MRLAELVACFAIAADAGMGMPMDHGLRSAAVAARLGAMAGASARACADAYYLSFLRYVGCTADSDIASDVWGDEVQVRGALYGVDWGAPAQVMPRMMRAVSGGRGLRGAARATVAAVKMPRLFETGRSHCEVGDQLAIALGFDESFRAALRQTFERWDGKGFHEKLKGEQIALAMRLAQAAEDIEIGHRSGGVAGAQAHVAKRTRRTVDPRFAELVRTRGEELCAPLDAPSPWTAAMDAEPLPHRIATDENVDAILRAMGDFADLKSRFTRGHARGVARLVRVAAAELALPAETAKLVERAAYLHDVGRVAVSAGVWDKPGPLTDAEWERVRMHTYVGERILARATSLAPVAAIAAAAHERLDASGYHRRLDAAACTAPARLLAVADVYQALTELRPHRPARSRDEAARELRALADAGRLCPDAVRAVLVVAGHDAPPAPPTSRALPAGLSEREVEVLRDVARGRTNKEVAASLGISPKTVSRHLESIYGKIGVTTRAAASMYAMQHGLMG